MEEYDVIIIGSGPAGLAAAIYAMRARLNTILIEETGMSGGQILNTYEVDNYPGLQGINGFDLGMKMREHADHFAITVETGRVEEIILSGDRKEVRTADKTYYGKAVIAAMGATYAKLGILGEQELLGKGVSYCATCDGAFFRDKVVAVVGGGNVAVEDAIYVSRFASKVYLIHRRDQLRATTILQEKLLETANIEVLWNTKVLSILGENVVEGIQVQQDTQQKTIQLNGIFIAVGMIPNTNILKNVVSMDEKGYVIADETCETNCPGIYACGDLRTKQLRQVVTAVADGANAITSVEHYLLQF